jgi:hypothetical protein
MDFTADGEEIIYSNWAHGHPHTFDNRCIILYWNGHWKSGNCSEEMNVFCQKGK